MKVDIVNQRWDIHVELGHLDSLVEVCCRVEVSDHMEVGLCLQDPLHHFLSQVVYQEAVEVTVVQVDLLGVKALEMGVTHEERRGLGGNDKGAVTVHMVKM